MEKARRFASATSAPTYVDTAGALARALGFKVVPNGFVFDREGRLIGEKLGGFDIRRDESRQLLETWLARPSRAPGAAAPVGGAQLAPDAEPRSELVVPDDPLDAGDARNAAGDLAGAGAAYGKALGQKHEDAMALFALGAVHLRAGRSEEALRLWHRAYLLDEANFLIRKQIWRALYPERFPDDRIDTDWQKEQMRREEELGFSVANPQLPPWTPR